MKFICNPKCKSGSGGGVQGHDFAGDIVCASGCSIGGKAFKFYAPQPNFPLVIKPSLVAIAYQLGNVGNID